MNLTLLIIMTITITFGLILIITFFLGYNFRTLREVLQWISSVGLFFTVMVGWIGVGIGHTEYTTSFTIDGQISISEKSITVDDYQRSYVYYFDKKMDFDNITDSTTFYIWNNYNMYNGTNGTFVYYEVDSIKYWGKILK